MSNHLPIQGKALLPELIDIERVEYKKIIFENWIGPADGGFEKLSGFGWAFVIPFFLR